MGFFSIGGFEMLLLAVVAVVLFGGRLPEVARTVGGYYQQFRNGLADIQDSIKNDLDVRKDIESTNYVEDHSYIDDEEPAPRFDPPEDDDA